LGRFAVPTATGDLSVTFLGVATLLITDGESALMTDGFFSRPGLVRVASSKLAPNLARIDEALTRMDVSSLSAVVPVHSHYDHVLDSAVVAERTGAQLVGGESTANVGRGHQLPMDQIRVVAAGESTDYGRFTVTHVESSHCPPDRYPGDIREPVTIPARASAYRCGEAWSLLLRHDSGRTALVQGSAGFVPGALAGRQADVVYLGVGQLGVQSEAYIQTYWEETVRTVGAQRVVLIHWDDFFRPLDRPLRTLPFVGDDLDVTMRTLGALASRDGVVLDLPSVWQREDPWAGLTRPAGLGDDVHS
jgi:L-ascorbate metabolism protein UlaG (beta-lactamase superfamily)